MKKGLVIILCFGMLFFADHATALDLFEVEPNDIIATAQNIDASFSLGPNPDVGNATTVPWVSIDGTGNGSFDFYEFTTSGSVTGVFDIDYGALFQNAGSDSFDAYLRLYTGLGTQIASNDDSLFTDGAGGSVPSSSTLPRTLDSYLVYSFTTPGQYYIRVGSFSGNPVPSGARYELQVSIPQHPVVPEPATVFLIGVGLFALVSVRRKLKS